LLNRQYQGDYSAVDILVDLRKAIELAQLTGRQSEALHLVYEMDLTQEDAGRAMGIGRRAVACRRGEGSHHGEGRNQWRAIYTRFGLLERLTEWYYEKTGEMPDGIALERMSDLCLYEDLNNPSLTKMQDEEYPIMSERQFDRRQSAEIATGKRDG
jgi:hypothetical protein